MSSGLRGRVSPMDTLPVCTSATCNAKLGSLASGLAHAYLSEARIAGLLHDVAADGQQHLDALVQVGEGVVAVVQQAVGELVHKLLTGTLGVRRVCQRAGHAPGCVACAADYGPYQRGSVSVLQSR